MDDKDKKILELARLIGEYEGVLRGTMISIQRDCPEISKKIKELLDEDKFNKIYEENE